MAQISFQANLGKIQGLKFGNDGKPRFQFSAAEGHRGKINGEWADTGTTWYSVTVFGYQAEDLAEVLQEGNKQRVHVTGRLSSREYEKDGQKRSNLDVVADIVSLVPAKQGTTQQASTWDKQPAQASAQWGTGNTADAPF
jgi:single-strand DNA-binding protein